jgi:hypothetical protein
MYKVDSSTNLLHVSLRLRGEKHRMQLHELKLMVPINSVREAMKLCNASEMVYMVDGLILLANTTSPVAAAHNLLVVTNKLRCGYH